MEGVVRAARAALDKFPYHERGDVRALSAFLSRCGDLSLFVLAHALREPTLVALLPSSRAGLTRRVWEEIDREYERLPTEARYQPRLTVRFGHLAPSVIRGYTWAELGECARTLADARSRPHSRVAFDAAARVVRKTLPGYGEYQSNHIVRCLLLYDENPVPGTQFLVMSRAKGAIAARRLLCDLPAANRVARRLRLPPFPCVGVVAFALCMSGK